MMDANEARLIEMKGMSEAQFQRWLIGLATDPACPYHWRIYHTKRVTIEKTGRAKTLTPVTAKGFPDLVIARDGRVIYTELKSEDGSPTLDQRWWLDVLANSGAEVYLWKPRHYEYIQEVLFNDFSSIERMTGVWGR